MSIVGYDDDDFEKNFCSDELDVKKSNLYNYIRFFTKIGDVRHITLEQGFSDRDVNSFGIDSGPTLNIYYNNEWWLVPFGYPYIQDSERTHKKTPEIKGPADVNSLDDGRFYARYAKRINEYYFVLAIDGNRRANDNYNYLGKKGDPLIKGKIRFTDQRGVLVSSSGVRVTDYTDIFDLQGIDEKFKKLNDSKSKRHYQLMIDGPFDLITNRTGLSEKATKDFRRNIIAKLNDFLQECYSNTKDHTFMHLIDRLGNDMRDHKLVVPEKSLKPA